MTHQLGQRQKDGGKQAQFFCFFVYMQPEPVKGETGFDKLSPRHATTKPKLK
jgi:hypothetical protein